MELKEPPQSTNHSYANALHVQLNLTMMNPGYNELLI